MRRRTETPTGRRAGRPRRTRVVLLAAGLLAAGVPALTASATSSAEGAPGSTSRAVRGEAPHPPRGLTLRESRTGKVQLRWKAPRGGAPVAGYDVYANGTLRTGLTDTTSTFTLRLDPTS